MTQPKIFHKPLHCNHEVDQSGLNRDSSAKQGGITCGAIDEPRKSSKAIDERVIINFRHKNVVIARFRDKNFLFYKYGKYI